MKTTKYTERERLRVNMKNDGRAQSESVFVIRKTMPKVTRALNGIEILSLNVDKRKRERARARRL